MNENEEWQVPQEEGDAAKRPRARFTRVERAYSSANYQQHQGGYHRDGYSNQGDFNNRGNFGNSNNSTNNSSNGVENHQSFENREGSFNRENSYSNRGGYSNNRGGYGYQQGGGYNNNRGGGYSKGRGGQGFGGNRGGYSKQGGYNNNRGGGYNQGGYNNRGGYNQGGYNNNRGGYNNNRFQGGPNRQRKPNNGFNQNAKYNMKKQIEYQEYLADPTAPIRLNKFLANAGVCSRREADDFIKAGVVTVNGNVVTELGSKVLRTDEVHFHDQLVSLEKKVYVILNKPKDYVTTSDDPQARKTVLDLVKDCCKERIYPVGRLDRNTTGVLLFTNDGELASKLSHPKYLKKKVYHVQLDKNCTIGDLRKLAEGIELEDGEIHADAISFASETDKKQVGIEIHSGKNRIVRRMFEALGYRVMKLDRVMFAGLTKKGLKRGDWRFLTEQEVAMLHLGGGVSAE